MSKTKQNTKTLTATQQLSKEGIKSRIIKLPCVSGGKKEIIMVYLENSALPSQSHSTSPPTQVMTQDGNRLYKLIFHIP